MTDEEKQKIIDEIEELKAQVKAIAFAADQADVYNLDFPSALRASERRIMLRNRIVRLKIDLAIGS